MGNGTAQAALVAKTRKLLADAERSELELARSKRLVVERAIVTQEWGRQVLAVKNRFLALGREVASRLTGLRAPEIQAVLDARVYEILMLLANPQYYPSENLEQDLKSIRPYHREEKHENGN
jgi:hypothetical protein